MEDKLVVRPFGILFEEFVENEDQSLESISEYDEDEDLNIVVLPDGSKKAIVEVGFSAGTKTETRQQREGPDDDLGSTGTRTVTNVKKETSDVDDTLFQSLSTKTSVIVQKEQPDKYPPQNFTFGCVLGTKTKTKETGESTDSD